MVAYMAKARSTKGTTKVLKSYRLAPDKLSTAQKILGAATATETIETALDMIIFRQELIDGTKAMLGVELTSPGSE